MKATDAPDAAPVPERRAQRRRRDDLPVAAVDLENLPMWLRAAVFLGVPSVIALFLVYVLTTQMTARMEHVDQVQSLQTQTIAGLKELGDDIRADLAAVRADTKDTRDHYDEAIARIDRLMRRVCLVVARSNDERNVCLGKTE